MQPFFDSFVSKLALPFVGKLTRNAVVMYTYALVSAARDGISKKGKGGALRQKGEKVNENERSALLGSNLSPFPGERRTRFPVGNKREEEKKLEQQHLPPPPLRHSQYRPPRRATSEPPDPPLPPPTIDDIINKEN